MKSITRQDIQRMVTSPSGGTGGNAGGGGAVGPQINVVSGAGTGNAITEFTWDSGTLTLNKGNTFVDLTADQTIGGTKTFTNTVWSVDHRISSDMRMKNFKEFIKIGLEQIANAPIIEYTWKDERDKDVHGGTYAQYWEKIAPWAVSEDEAGMLGMNYESLALVSVVELAREVVNLKQEIADLKDIIKRFKHDKD